MEPRHIAICVVRRGNALLLSQMVDSATGEVFYRAPGGGVEPAETPEQALRRELREELGSEAAHLRHLASLDREFVNEGRWQHEIQHVFAGELRDISLYELAGAIEIGERERALWVELAHLRRSGRAVYPEETLGLIGHQHEPVASVLLVHGAASGPGIFDSWTEAFPGVALATVDLHGERNVSRLSMGDYAETVARASRALREPFAVVAWSMGGLAAMMSVSLGDVRPACLVLLEPSAPAEVQGADETVPIEPGTYDGEELYGAFPPGVAARPESALARAERKRGISVASLPGLTLVVHGDEYAEERGRRVALAYSAETMPFPGMNHFDLVMRPEVRRAIAAHLGL